MQNNNGRTNTYQTRRRSIPLTVDDVTRNYILMLVGNLIADHNRLPEMGIYRLTPDMIPSQKDDKELNTARTMLQLMNKLAEADLPPNQENLMPGLNKVYGEEAESRYWAIWNHRGVQDDPSLTVSTTAFYLADWIAHRKMELTVEQMRHVVAEHEENAETLHAQLSDMLLQAAPQRRGIEIRSVSADLKAWRQELLEHKKNAEEKGSVGPESPFPTLNRKTGPLRKGELDLWSAKTGFGKSTIAWLLASHAAWGGRGGYNVLFFAFEQYPQSILERYAAERLNLTTLDFREFGHRPTDSNTRQYFDPNHPHMSDLLDTLEREMERLVEEKGDIWIVPAAGWGPYEIETEVGIRAAASLAQNRELYVLYDYYDLMNARGLQFYGSSQAAALEAITDFMRDAIGLQYEVYTTAFAQDSVNTDYVTRQMPFQSQRVYQRSQRYVRIERTVADRLLYALEDDGYTPVRDIFDRPILLHDAGQANSNSLLHIIKCNDGETGYVPVRFWNGRFKVEEQVLTPDDLKARVTMINRGNRNYERQ